jgi:hypothetical protein
MRDTTQRYRLHDVASREVKLGGLFELSNTWEVRGLFGKHLLRQKDISRKMIEIVG